MATRGPDVPCPRPEPVTRLPILILYPHSRCNCRCLMCDIWKKRTYEMTPGEVSAGRTNGGPRSRARGIERRRSPDALRPVHALPRAPGGRHPDHDPEHRAAAGPARGGDRGAHRRRRRQPRRPARAARRDPPRPEAFDRLADGVRAVREAEPAGAITARCVVQKAGTRRLRETVAAAHDLGLDGISFLAVDVSSEAFNRPGGVGVTHGAPSRSPRKSSPPRGRARPLSEGVRSGVRGRLHRGDRGEAPAAPAPLLRGRRGQGPYPTNVCNAPWVSSVVRDGRHGPAVLLPAALGNVREEGASKPS